MWFRNELSSLAEVSLYCLLRWCEVWTCGAWGFIGNVEIINLFREGGLKPVFLAGWEVVKVLHIKYWDGTRDVWKKRPRDVYLRCWWPKRGDSKCISLAPFTRTQQHLRSLSLSTSAAYRYWLCCCLFVCLSVCSLSLWQMLLTFQFRILYRPVLCLRM